MNTLSKNFQLLITLSVIVGMAVSTIVLLASFKPLGNDPVKENGFRAFTQINESTRGAHQPDSEQVVSNQTLRALRDLVVFKTREVAYCRLLIICQVVLGITLSSVLIFVAIRLKHSDLS